MRVFSRLVRGLLVVLAATLVHGVALAGKAGTPAADVGKIRELFEARKFAELSALLDRSQASCDRDIQNEFAVRDGFQALAAGTPSAKALFDDWVGGAPGNWVPLTARATWSLALGRKARGAKPAKGQGAVPSGTGSDNVLQAVRDLERSLRITPRQLQGYLVLMEICQYVGDRERGALVAKKALELYPNSYLLRHRHLMSLAPRWGGSYDAMERFARESARHAAANPRLKILAGLVPWDRGRTAASEGDYAKAIALFEESLAHGASSTVLYDLADSYYRAKQHDKALATLDRAAAIQPDAPEEQGLRSRIAFAEGKLDEALARLAKMEELQGRAPGDASETRVWESGRLVAAGHALFRGKDLAGAIDKYTEAIRFLARNADAYCWRGIARDRTGEPEAALADLRQAIDLNPRLYAAYKGLDDVLYRQRRLDEIADNWTRLIRLEPANANAYVDRSGVYTRMKDTARAVQDLTRACDLGNTQACLLLKSLPGGGGL